MTRPSKLTPVSEQPGDTIERKQWQRDEVRALFALPFNDLLFSAQQIHRQHFDANEIQLSTLLSIKTGACPEDCKYCSQASRYSTALTREKLMEVERVIAQAKRAKEQGAGRFCMGAAWRNPHERDMPKVLAMVEGVKALGMETCMTLGMLTEAQAQSLAEAGLDYYNHNLDTSKRHYPNVISTRSYSDRIETLGFARAAGLKLCCGGILGMGETEEDRMELFIELANMDQPPESVPINLLVKIPGTPLENEEDVDPLDFVRSIALARHLMPQSRIRLSAGREAMDESTQALCFLAGANSIFYGDTLLTTENPRAEKDRALFKKLGLRPAKRQEAGDDALEHQVVSSLLSENQNKLFYEA